MIHWCLKNSSTRCGLIPPVRCTLCLGRSTWGSASSRLTWAHGSQAHCRRDAGRVALGFLAVLDALSHLFTHPWDQPVTGLSAAAQVFILNEAGGYFAS